jgi:hypothetical protein
MSVMDEQATEAAGVFGLIPCHPERSEGSMHLALTTGKGNFGDSSARKKSGLRMTIQMSGGKTKSHGLEDAVTGKKVPLKVLRSPPSRLPAALHPQELIALPRKLFLHCP